MKNSALRGLALAAGLLLSAAPAAQAQQDGGGPYTVSVLGGMTDYDASSALRAGGYAGVEILYNITPNIALGGYGIAARPTTDETFFPFVRLEFSDTVFYYLVNQQLVALDYGLLGAFNVPVGPLALTAGAGVGRYALRYDPQRAERPVVPGQEERGFGGMEYMLSGGVAYNFAGGGGVRLQVRDVIYTGYERDRLSLAEPLLGPEAVPHPRPDRPEAESTIHNLRYELGFSFTPRGDR